MIRLLILSFSVLLFLCSGAQTETNDAAAKREALEKLDKKTLCIKALTYTKTAWDEGEAYRQAAEEAKRRGLSIIDCRSALGLRLTNWELIELNRQNKRDFAEIPSEPAKGTQGAGTAERRIAVNSPSESPKSLQSAAKRVALVIGNDKYPNLAANRQLEKAVNDAGAVRDALISLGFEVLYVENASLARMKEMLFAFSAKLQEGDIAVFYYAGHGVTLSGTNYLLPSDIYEVSLPEQAKEADIVAEQAKLAEFSVRESLVLGQIAAKRPKVSLIVLDACRDNPLRIEEAQNPFRSTKPGDLEIGDEFAAREPRAEAEGLLIVYSASFGQRALDRLPGADDDPNSPFTRTFLKKLMQPGLGLKEVVGQTRDEVFVTAKSVGRSQTPAIYEQLIGGDVFLNGEPQKLESRSESDSELTPGDPAEPPPNASRDAEDAAAREWAMVKSSENGAAIEAFRDKHKDNSFYRELAEEKLAKIVPPVIPALLKTWEIQYGSNVDYRNFKKNSDGSILLNGINMAAGKNGNELAINLKIDTANLSGVSDQGAGLYKISEVNYQGILVQVSVEKSSPLLIDIPSMIVEDWYVKTVGDNPSATDLLRSALSTARRTSYNNLVFKHEDQVVTAGKFEITWRGDPITGSGSMNAKISDIVFSESVLSLMDTEGYLKKLGYNNLTLNVGWGGNLSNDGLHLDISGYAFCELVDIGTFTQRLNLMDIPIALVSTMQTMKPNDPTDKLMLQAGNLKFAGASLRFEDASITKKILPMLAKELKVDTKTLIKNAPFALEYGLKDLKSPKFAKGVATAIGAYLASPKSITISSKPVSALSLGQLTALDFKDHPQVIGKLGLSVAAND